ncbi:MAG: hypothetical protein B6D61_14540 [Bacteroidetes bacterium 4484_249]|nr:MAG: hypothetical protein B6D61_14540 [Bacteroidetes bacterium 4484_249]
MKKILLISLLLFTLTSYTQTITRGPDLGELYFMGSGYTTDGLYYSTNFGETAIFVDSMDYMLTIAADKTQGGIYCVKMPENLYYSDNYGYSNSWEFKYSSIYLNSEITSGIVSSHIFSSYYMHSEDYGANFINHACNGFSGSRKNVSIDNINENIGYVLSYEATVADTVYLFRTNDKFETLELIRKFNYMWYEAIELSRGFNTGEIFMFNFTRNELWNSFDYFENIQLTEVFNFDSYYNIGIEGGCIEGELFILYNFVNQLWHNAHIYIYHSTDYGKSFEVFHPFAKGNEPILANFSTIEKEVYITTPIEFSNFSIGEIQEYQWDFDNDGVIDSYEEFPVHIYQDTGWYSVKLSVVGTDSINSFIKPNYIHIIDTTTIIKDNLFEEIAVAPNPFKDRLTIKSDFILESFSIIIYNLKGEIAFETFNHNNKSFIINTSELKSGVYVLNISSQNNSSNYKIIKK